MPKDKAKRQKSMKKDMPEYIQAYYGNDVAIAAAMKVTPAEVREVVASEPRLLDLMEIADTSQESLLLDRMQYLAMNSNSPAACRWVLERKYPERYGKTPAAAKTKSSGFTAPTEEPEDLESVLGPTKTEITEA